MLMDSVEKRVVHILWTGGLDSTYRVVELSRTDCVIQPHYIVLKRGSIKNELRAIRKITNLLQKDGRTKARIMPPVIVTPDELEPYPDIQFVWDRLQKKKNFQSRQYPILTCYARKKNIKLEMGLQFSENGTVVKVLDESVLVDHPEYDDVMMVDPEKGESEWASYIMFRDFLFPKSLFHKTKREEIDELKQQGYGKVLKHVWTCYKPILGLPCGHCFPCRSAKKEGAREMVSFVGNLLGAARLHLQGLFKQMNSRENSDNTP